MIKVKEFEVENGGSTVNMWFKCEAGFSPHGLDRHGLEDVNPVYRRHTEASAEGQIRDEV